MFRPEPKLTNRQPFTIIRFDWMWSAWHRFELGHICDNFTT